MPFFMGNIFKMHLIEVHLYLVKTIFKDTRFLPFYSTLFRNLSQYVILINHIYDYY
jgi:hypothetical protein